MRDGAARCRVVFRRFVVNYTRASTFNVRFAFIRDRELWECARICSVVRATVVFRRLVGGPKYDETAGGRGSVLTYENGAVPGMFRYYGRV